MENCKHCGADLGVGSTRKWCRGLCRDRYRSKQRTLARLEAEAKMGRNCQKCNNPITGSLNIRFCSDQCRSAAYRDKLHTRQAAEQIDQIVENSKDICCVCKKPGNTTFTIGKKSKLWLGMMCGDCRAGLLMFKENPVLLMNMLKVLQKAYIEGMRRIVESTESNLEPTGTTPSILESVHSNPN